MSLLTFLSSIIIPISPDPDYLHASIRACSNIETYILESRGRILYLDPRFNDDVGGISRTGLELYRIYHLIEHPIHPHIHVLNYSPSIFWLEDQRRYSLLRLKLSRNAPGIEASLAWASSESTVRGQCSLPISLCASPGLLTVKGSG